VYASSSASDNFGLPLASIHRGGRWFRPVVNEE
jgi:hypothetical protein